MTLDPPAAAARRQFVLDRIVEDLVGWGCPLDHAPARAARLLDRVLDAGYALPVVLAAPPPRGGGSTDEGRARARAAVRHTMVGCRCDPFAARALPPAEHPIGCPVRDAHDAQRAPALPGRSDEQPHPGVTGPERVTSHPGTVTE